MDQFEQPRLYRLAVEAVALTAVYTGGVGWQVTIAARRQYETWPEARVCTYDRLTTAELADVVEADLREALGL